MSRPASGPGMCRAPSDVDEERALAALRVIWGAAYAVCFDDGIGEGERWQAWRICGNGAAIAGSSPDELNAAIRADWGTGMSNLARPVFRQAIGEPGLMMRLARYRAEHPAVIIGEGEFGTWQARIPEPDGETIIVRHRLAEVLDKLDELIGETAG